MTSRTWALAALISLPATACIAEDDLVSSDQLESTAVIDDEDEQGRPQRWARGEIPVYVDATGGVAPFYCGQAAADGDRASGQPFSPADLDNIAAGIDRWDDFTPLTFVPVEPPFDPDAPPMLIISRSTGGGQTLPATQSPAWWCIVVASGVTPAGVAHELGHAIGLIHEQRRPDRDNFVRFVDTCVQPSGLKAFEPFLESEVNELGPYDFDSLMHYPSFTKCCNPGDAYVDPDTLEAWICPEECNDASGTCQIPPLTRLNDCSGSGCLISAAKDVSTGDINAVFRMYEKALDTDDSGDLFGAAMVTGDFDGDDFLDLAIGAPGEDNQGAVYLWRGTSVRLVAWKKLTSRLATPGGRFGAALAAGDLDGDGRTDLAVGAPGEGSESNPAKRGGNVHLFQAVGMPRLSDLDAMQLRHFGLEFWIAYDAKKAGATVANAAEFGAAIAIADVTQDGRKDLIIGAPGGALAAIQAGYVAILAGQDDLPFNPLGDRPLAWTRISKVGFSTERHGERFGEALGTFIKDGLRWLVVGAPENEIVGGVGHAYTFSPGLWGMPPIDVLGPGPGFAFESRFGAAIATGKYGVNGTLTYVAIGAPEADGWKGKIFIHTVGGDSLVLKQTLKQAPSAQPDRMGSVLAVVTEGAGPQTLIAGLPFHDKGSLTDAGAYLAFIPVASLTNVLTPTGELKENLSAAPAPQDHFGSSIATMGIYLGDGSPDGRGLVVAGDGFGAGGAFMAHDPWWGFWRQFDQRSADPI